MYEHTQMGWVMLVSLGIGILLLIICVILFSRLTVTGDDDLIEVRFGPGLIKKKFRLEEIESAKTVKNRWWYGWGIRKMPKGWLFNVSGLDAVELSMKNGRTYRIGTDEPQKLNEFIQRKLKEGKE